MIATSISRRHTFSHRDNTLIIDKKATKQLTISASSFTRPPADCSETKSVQRKNTGTASSWTTCLSIKG
jgi:hypothetical protein